MAAADLVAAKTVEATVAAGRSVVDVTGALRKQGEKAKVDARDLERLRDLGYLAKKDEDVVLPKPGPRITGAEGPRVTVV